MEVGMVTVDLPDRIGGTLLLTIAVQSSQKSAGIKNGKAHY